MSKLESLIKTHRRAWASPPSSSHRRGRARDSGLRGFGWEALNFERAGFTRVLLVLSSLLHVTGHLGRTLSLKGWCSGWDRKYQTECYEWSEIIILYFNHQKSSLDKNMRIYTISNTWAQAWSLLSFKLWLSLHMFRLITYHKYKRNLFQKNVPPCTKVQRLLPFSESNGEPKVVKIKPRRDSPLTPPWNL